MKALSVRQPWAWAIVNGYKDVENRDWPTRYRGRVLIHASKREEKDDVDFVIPLVAHKTGRAREDVAREYGEHLEAGGLGAVVGAVTITDCVSEMESDWFFGRFGFVMADPRAVKPAPCKGQLSFFDVPPEVAAALRSGFEQGENDGR